MSAHHAPSFSRRSLIGAAASLCAGLALPGPARAALSQRPSSDHRAALQAAFGRLGERIAHRDRAVLVDFSFPSAAARLHFIDLEAGRTRTLLVAHGRGSDPAHSGWLQRFSNRPGSAASSRGAYVTDALYTGQHGRSQRLIGLDPTNDQAHARAIVIHAAWYAEPAMIERHGVLGRSEGCFALGARDLGLLLDTLGPGRLLLADRF
jgi:hypothetical protein